MPHAGAGHSRQTSRSGRSRDRPHSAIYEPPDAGRTPKLGGKAAMLLFVAILLAFVVQSGITQVLTLPSPTCGRR